MRLIATGLALLILVLQFRLWVGEGSIPAMRRMQAAVAEQRAENERLDERNAALAADVADLRSGLQSVEERARRDMGMIGADEQFYRVIIPRD
ncbi:septum formation initiator family protein [Spiribacter vilamensis]|uniref:Cell division protein FtsB n=1 Tax=Spiribacter vilamensis TaxID=531306 RepID=A0A4Q8CZU1_9GAMM|nr:septum formation initiator family protein [Spiribacter vilamensis]RZU98467.1 cell division protein FtsB [Spiribacter vilamensis]TVO60661.1 cell division protein FtsB [Spiribacter vilamensis]